jgi:hypothetical protein
MGICVARSREKVTSRPSPTIPDSFRVRTASDTALVSTLADDETGFGDVTAELTNESNPATDVVTCVDLSIATTLIVLSAVRGKTLTGFQKGEFCGSP